MSNSNKVARLKYCADATELPYGKLYRSRQLTVAIAASRRIVEFPPAGDQLAPQFLGVLHGASTYEDGTAEPLLPVQIDFAHRDKGMSGPVGDGWLDTHHGHEATFYFLRMEVSDPGGRLASAVQEALSRAALSRERFLHLHFTRAGPEDAGGFVAEQLAEDRELLRRVVAREANLPKLVFEKLHFEDRLVTQAEAWGWAWPSFELLTPAFSCDRTAKWRKLSKKWR